VAKLFILLGLKHNGTFLKVSRIWDTVGKETNIRALEGQFSF
jgi:hypothetical protein